MTRPGWKNSVVPAVQVEALSVNWTNLSIFAAVDGLLLRRVAVVLVAGQGLGVGQPLRVVARSGCGQQRADRAAGGDLGVQAVHRRRAGLGVERAPVGVGRVRVGAEVVVERLVLVEDHHHVLDRRRGRGHVGTAARRAGRRDGHRVDGVLAPRSRLRDRGPDGDAGAQDDGGGDGRVIPDSPLSGADVAGPSPISPSCVCWLNGRRTPRGSGTASARGAHPGAKAGITG